MMHFLAIGILLGVSAGLAPGPLLALVISETLQYGIRSGVKVALSPMITDLPIILLTVFLLSKLSGFHKPLGLVSLVGGSFLLYTGYDAIRIKAVSLDIEPGRPKSFAKGILANALNPHPYLFWLSVGAPILARAAKNSILSPFVFLCGFYALLLGSKILLAIAVGKSRSLLQGNAYIYILRFLGLMLCGLAVALFRDGLTLLGVL